MNASGIIRSGSKEFTCIYIARVKFILLVFLVQSKRVMDVNKPCLTYNCNCSVIH